MHNILHRRQKSTEQQATCTDNLVMFGCAVFEISEWTGGRVISVVCMVLLQLDCDEDGGLRGEEDEPDFYVQAHMPV